MRKLVTMVALGLAICVASTALAQPGGGQGRRGGGGFGGFGGGGGAQEPQYFALLRVKEVQDELDLIEEQIEDVQKIEQESRPQFDRNRFQGLSEDERNAEIEKMRKERADLSKKLVAKLKDVLFEEQFDRLHEIALQQMGSGALMNADVQKALKFTAAQKTKLEETSQKSREDMMEQMRGMFGQGGRGGRGGQGGAQGRGGRGGQGGAQGGQGGAGDFRARFEEMRKKADEQMLTVLTSTQSAEFKKMKGKEFEMPEGAMRRGFGGRGGQGAQGRGGRGGQGGQGRGGRGGGGGTIID